MQFRRIRQRKDDGSVDVLGHFSDHVLGEGARLRRGSDQDVRSYLFDHFEQVVVSLAGPVRVGFCVGVLGGREFVFVRAEEEAGFVDAPDIRLR